MQRDAGDRVLMRGTSDAMETRCVCGAVGRILPPGEPGDVPVPLIEWAGGNIGARRIAVEYLSPGTVICRGCQHRACVYIVGSGRGR